MNESKNDAVPLKIKFVTTAKAISNKTVEDA
jgi:hypothetical protein